MRVKILLLVGMLLMWVDAAIAIQIYNAGFRTIGVFEEEPLIRVDINVWYPSIRGPKDLDFPPWTLNAALNGKPANGHFPLIIVSHDTSTDRFAYHGLAAWLAREGYIVIAPTHGTDNMSNMDDLFTWQQLARRVQDLNKSLELVLKDKDLAPIADSQRIGIAGFGSGATVALLLGGALPDCGNWEAYCARAGKRDVYCSPWAVERMDNMCKSFPLQRSLADPRIKAVAAIAPAYGMLFAEQSFRYFYPPLLLVAAGKAKFNRVELHCEPLARLLGNKARYLELPDADEAALMSECPKTFATELPELCNSVTPAQREHIYHKLGDTLLAFFNHYLVRNVLAIPAPPDLAPLPPVEEKTPPPQNGKKKR